MELFKNTNYDFLGKKWPFIIASLVLTVAGLASIVIKGGLKYGIDFKGGALMTVKFAYAPPLDKIRSAMSHSSKIKGEVTVQNFTGSGAPERGARSAPKLQEREAVERQPAGDGGRPAPAPSASRPAASWTSTTPASRRWPTACAIRWRAPAFR